VFKYGLCNVEIIMNRNLEISENVSLRWNEQVLSSLRFGLRVGGHFSVDSDQIVYFLLLYINNLCLISAVSQMFNVKLCSPVVEVFVCDNELNLM